MAGETVGYATLPVIPSFSGIGAALTTGISGPAATAGATAGDRAGAGMKTGILNQIKTIAAPLIAAIGVAGVTRGITSSVNAASDLVEAGTAVGQVFGSSFPAIETWAQGAATSLGQSNLSALNAARTFGVYGQSAGLAGDANVQFAKGMTTLATDLASFNNTSPEQAIEAIGAALRGESEPIRSYGVLLDDATIRQRAFEMGIIDSTKNALTPQQRVLAVQAEILAQTGVAQGDFMRTSEGLANQQRILSAQWTDVSAKIGTLFLPMVTAVVSYINTSLMPVLDQVPGALSAIGAILFEGKYESGSLFGLEADSPVVSILYGIRDAAIWVWDAVSQIDFGAIFSGLSGGAGAGEATASALSSIGDSAVTLAPLVGDFIGLLPSFTDVLNFAADAVGWLADNSETLAAMLPVLAGGYLVVKAAQLTANVASAATPALRVAEVAANLALSRSQTRLAGTIAASTVAQGVNTAATSTGVAAKNAGVAATIRQTAANVASRTAMVAAAIATGVVTAAQWAWNVALTANPIGIIIVAITALVGALVWFFTQTELGQDIWTNVTNAIGTAVTWLWETILQPVFTAIGAIFTWIYDFIIVPIVTGIMIYIGLWAAVITWLWENVISPVFAAIGAIFEWIWNSIIMPIVNFIIAYVQMLGAIFTWLWNNAINPAIQAVGAAWNWLWTNVIKPVADFIGSAIKTVGDTVRTVFGGIADFIGTAFNAALSVVRGPINGIISLVNGAIDGLNSLSVTIPSWVPIVGGQTWGLSIPKIPRLATGADVMARPGGTLAILAEAGQAETVTNLGDTNRQIRASTALAEAALAGKGSTNVRVFIGDKELTDFVRVVVEDYDDEGGDRVDRGARPKF